MDKGEHGTGFLTKRLSLKTVFILLMICLTLLLIPLLYVSRYNVPCADDYSYGDQSHRIFEDGGSPLAIISSAVDVVVDCYYHWQGSYSAIFLMTLQPAIFGAQFYALTTFIMLFSLLFGLFFFCYTFFGKLFGADKYACGIIAVLMAVLCTQFPPSPVEAFYWYNGAIYYTFFFGLCLTTYALLLRLIFTEKKRPWGLWIGCALLLVIIAGGNYVSALITAELLFSVSLALLLLKNPRWKSIAPLFLLFMLAFLVSVTAPGNAVRQENFAVRPGVVDSVLFSFSDAAANIVRWTNLSVAALLIFSVPISGAVALRTKYRFGYPLLFTLGSFCLLASMHCPPIYAMGRNMFSGRIIDIIYFAFVILAFLNVFYWTGWLLRRYEQLHDRAKGPSVWFTAALLVMFSLGMVLCIRQQTVTSPHAAAAVISGCAQSYSATAQQRLEILEDDSIEDAVLPPYEYLPAVLFFDDVCEDSSDWRNLSVSEYFDKNTVRLAVPYADYWK